MADSGAGSTGSSSNNNNSNGSNSNDDAAAAEYDSFQRYMQKLSLGEQLARAAAELEQARAKLAEARAGLRDAWENGGDGAGGSLRKAVLRSEARKKTVAFREEQVARAAREEEEFEV